MKRKKFGTEGQPMAITEVDGLRAYASMLNTLEVGAFGDYLADDFVYESQNVLTPLVSKQAFLDYIASKLQTIARSGATVYAEMGSIDAYGRERPCVILAQNGKSNLVSVVLGEFAEGKLKRLDLCVVPPPQSADRSGEYPGLIESPK